MQKTHVDPAKNNCRDIHASNKTTKIFGSAEVYEISAQRKVESRNGGVQGSMISKAVTPKGIMMQVDSARQR